MPSGSMSSPKCGSFTALWSGLPKVPPCSQAILDVGARNGLLSALLLEKSPGATITLLDISEKMLAVARERFRDRPTVRFCSGDYSRVDLSAAPTISSAPPSRFAVWNRQTDGYFPRIFSVLKPGGIFANADQA